MIATFPAASGPAPTAGPLAQARRFRGVGTPQAPRGLSETDAAALTAILAKPYEYMDHPLFELPRAEAERKIFDEPDPIDDADTSWYGPAMSWVDESRPPRATSRTRTAAEERVIFAQYNYCRFRVATLRNQVADQAQPDPDVVQQMLHWHHRAEAFREQIAGLNLALVLAMAKRIRAKDVDWPEMISEGNMALLRSVEKFDITRGFKFSTYACRAILKGFSRQGLKHAKYRSTFPVDFDPQFERSNHQETRNAEHEKDCVDELREIIRRNKARLSDVERGVIERRFAVGEHAGQGPDGAPRPLTLEQVGKAIGITKERVRQIQSDALEKLKGQFNDHFLR